MIGVDVTVQPHEDEPPHLAEVGGGWRRITPGRTCRGQSTTSEQWPTREAAAAALSAGGDRR